MQQPEQSLPVISYSVATAAVLVMLGHEVRRVFNRPGNGPGYEFAPTAESDLRRFRTVKAQLDRRAEEA